MEIKLNTAYFVAKEELLFSNFEGLLSLQRKNELSINFTYANKKSCAESDDEGRIESQGIGDASGEGVAAAVYTAVVQEESVNRGLVASRAR